MKIGYAGKRIMRWIWLRLYNEDLRTMLLQRERLQELNMVHCEFLDKLENEHPELFLEIRSHQSKRGEIA